MWSWGSSRPNLQRLTGSKDTNRHLLSHSTLASSNASKNFSLSSLKIPQQVEMPANSKFLEERYREERLSRIFCLYFCCRHTPSCSSNALKGTEAVYVHEHNIQPEPSLCRTYQVGLISRLTTTMPFQSAPSITRVSLCLPAKHSVVPVVPVVAWFVEVLITHSYHLRKAVMRPRSPFCASVSLSQTQW